MNASQRFGLALAFPVVLAGWLLAAATAPAQTCPASWVNGIGTPGIGTTSGTAVVYASTMLAGGDVIVGGNFTSAGGVSALRIVRHNPTTNIWSSLGTGVQDDPWPPFVYALMPLPSGDLVVGGVFASVGGVAVNNIARYNPATNIWSAMGAGVSGGTYQYVRALSLLPSGDLVVGGNFASAGGVPVNNIARYNPATNIWSALGTGITGSGATVNALAVLPPGVAGAGDVIVGGDFTTAGGVATSYIARYNPGTNSWSALGAGVNAYVYALAVLPSGVTGAGDVIVGGGFTSAGGVSGRNRIARYNPSTSAWSALGTGIAGSGASVYALAVLPPGVTGAGDVIVGGAGFSAAGGVSASRIARYNPATNAWSALGAGVSSDVNALTVLLGGEVIVGGSFTAAGGLPASKIARYTFGGTAVSIGQHPISARACIGSSASFSVVATGTMPSYQWRKGGVDINNSINPSAATATLQLANVAATDGGAYDCVVSNSCGASNSNIASLTIGGPECAGACNVSDIVSIGGLPPPDGLLTGDDFNAFINAFAAGDSLADIVAIGGLPPPDGLITGDDFNAFINGFAAGCP